MAQLPLIDLWKQWMEASKAFETSMASLAEGKLPAVKNPLISEEFKALMEKGAEINRNLLELSAQMQKCMTQPFMGTGNETDEVQQ